MCSLEEANEAYRYIGFPGYNPHIKKEVFYKYYDLAKGQELANNSKQLLLINSIRVFHIAEEGRCYQEREDLARTYFDKVLAVECSSPENYKNHTVLLQIYIVNKNRDNEGSNIYGFRPIKENSYLFHRLIKNGFLCGDYNSLKKIIDWSYLPLSVENKESVKYICNATYFRKNLRKRLKEQIPLSIPNKNDYNWIYWPDLN